MNQITYLFGAGASCQAMPVVNDFTERFEIYLRYLKSRNFFNLEFILVNEDFISQVKNHLSFDTFFKKLFHLNKVEDIARYKKILLYYLIYEHLMPIHEYKKGFLVEEKIKTYLNDPRYDSLVAGLLKPKAGILEFYTNINFLTWNYDLNLLAALRNFLFAGSKIPQIINRYQYQQNMFSFLDQVKLIHLNGFINHPKFDDLQEYSFSDLEEMFAQLIEEFENGEFNKEPDNQKRLNFAWENNMDGELPAYLSSAIEAINQSHTLIITGYSFPLYNRFIDLKLINSKLLLQKTVVIRDPRAKEIKEILQADFGLVDRATGIGLCKIQTSTNCDSFFIPNQLFQ